MREHDVLPELSQALRERLAVISDHELRASHPAEQLSRLKSVSEKIHSLQEHLPPGSDPRLVHFLKNCSYDKALAWLESAAHSASEN